MKKLMLASLMVLGFGFEAQGQYVYPAPVVPVYPAPVVAYPAPTFPLFPVTPVAPLVPVTPVMPLVPVSPVVAPVVPATPGCYWASVPVTSWQWVQGVFGGWRLRLVTTFQNQLICR